MVEIWLPRFQALYLDTIIVVVVQSLSRVRLFVTPWTAALQVSLSFAISRSLLKLMSIESVMPSNHLILCRPLLLPSIFPRFRVFSSELALCIRWSKYLLSFFFLAFSYLIFNWRIIALQCCISFCLTTMWISSPYLLIFLIIPDENIIWELGVLA